MPVFPTNDRGIVLESQRRTVYLAVAVLLGHVLLISAQVSSRTGVSLLETVLFSGLSQVQLVSARAVQSVTGAWSEYVALRQYRHEAERLQAEIDRMGVELQQARAQARRTEQLELLLQLNRTTLPQTVAARVIAADPTAVFRTVTIDRGHADGIRRDMAVLSPLGVVGRVIDEPGRHSAKVQLITDRNAGVGAHLERTGTGGVVVGADDDPPLRMEYVSNLAEVEPGDLVATSGLDGIYPRGYVIGRVERAERGSGLYREIRIRPRVDFSALDTVLVVTAPPRQATSDDTP
jgi:rod shape-determining protein MreC